MNKFILFLKTSNRYMHLLGGLIVGICALDAWPAIYAALIAASCLELKDRMHGCMWDWTDWLLTTIGGIIAALIWLLI